MEFLRCHTIKVGEYREHWLDLAKGIGIIFVVLAHSISREEYVWVLINQFHMPLIYNLWISV